MLTIFSCPKPFRGNAEIAQRNSIRSWIELDPKPEIILLGNDEGVAEAAREYRVKHIPEVACNEFGTPLISSLFEESEKASSNPLMCYVNADIIFVKDFMEGIRKVRATEPDALMVGRRWNIDMEEPIDFEGPWQDKLKARVALEGKLYPYFAIDYFVFPKKGLGSLPPFAIGRPAWDNWVIYRACTSGMPVVDMTEVVTAIHQNHDYSHHPEGWKGAMKGEESKRNIALAGEIAHVHSLLDAKYRLTSRGIRRRFPPFYVPFYLYKLLVVFAHSHSSVRPLVRLIRAVGDRVSARQ